VQALPQIVYHNRLSYYKQYKTHWSSFLYFQPRPKGVGGMNNKKIKICKFCGNPVNKKPESKKEKNKRIMKGINKLKKRGIFQ